jgi:predicted nucleotidyltransferase
VTEHEGALRAVVRGLDELAVPYAVIGGLANAVWGEPRATLDIDVTVRVAEGRTASVIEELARRFASVASDPHAFVSQHAVLPLRSEGGVRIDIIFARLPFEEDVVARAVPIDVGGVPVRFCTAEDLILMKIASERSRDQDDAMGVTRRRLGELDMAYLEPRVRELATLLEQPSIVERWSAWKGVAE